jgi:mono/diheme cytochrome c family protein
VGLGHCNVVARATTLWASALLLGSACGGDVGVAYKPVRTEISSPSAAAGQPPSPSHVDPGTAPAGNAEQAEQAGATAPELDPRRAFEPDDALSCAALATEAESMLTQYCQSCHGNGGREGGFGSVLDVPAMLSQGKLVASDRRASKLYTVIESGQMPRGDASVNPSELAALGAWIDCGAPDWNASSDDAEGVGFIDIEARLEAIDGDLSELEQDDRDSVRYVDFTHLSNAGIDTEQLTIYRSAVTFLLNSLSSEDEVVSPSWFGPAQLLARIELADFGWNAATWELIVADYPYAVRYEDSRFAADEGLAQRIRERTQTSVPYVQADWLLAHASRPPLYYQILEIPTDLNELADSLDIDVADDVEDSRVARAGFNGSGISAQNRVIERHDNPASGGAFWLSYDFRANVGLQNIFAHPYEFQQDGGEGIYHLPNGLQAYVLADANLARIDKAPTDIVSDPNTKDRAVEAGLSCMGGCHLTRGIIVKDDAVRSYVLNTPAAEPLRERTLELYPEVDQMRAHMDQDNQRYLDALRRTGFDSTDENALHKLVSAHEDLLDLRGVAATVGVSQAAFSAALEADDGDFPLEIVALVQPGATIYRDVLETRFDDIVSALGLGEALEL